MASSGTGYCNASQYEAITSILGEAYAYAAASVCSSVNVSSQTPQNAVIQWTVGGLLSTQAAVASTSSNFTEKTDEIIYGLDVSFVLLEAFGVFCMQTGFALFAAGVVRAKSVSSILLKSFIDTGISAVCFYLVGYAFAFGANEPTNGFIGNADFALSQMSSAPVPNHYHLFFWNWVFCAASTTILSGAVAERATLLSYCLYAVFYSSWVYPVAAHWNWSNQGWLSPTNPDPLLGVGCIDFAGSGVVHTIGGVSAVVAALFLGPRIGRFEESTLLKDFKFGHNPPLYMLGTFMLWFGWYGFNPGSNLAIATYNQATVVSRTAVTTTLAAAAGSLCALLAVYWRTRTWDMLSTCSGALAGLVSITAGCSVVEPWAALICGGFAGMTVMWGDDVLEHWQIDDPACAFIIHGLSGVWGVMFVGFLAKGTYIHQVYNTTPSYAREGIFYGGHGQLLLCQFISVVVIIAWAVFWMGLFFGLLQWFGILRVTLDDEAVGLDVAAMNEGRAPSTQFLRAEHKSAMPNGHDFNKISRLSDLFPRSPPGSLRGGNNFSAFKSSSLHGQPSSQRNSQHGGGNSQHGNNNSQHGSSQRRPIRPSLSLQHMSSKERDQPLLHQTSTSSQVAGDSSVHNQNNIQNGAPSPGKGGASNTAAAAIGYGRSGSAGAAGSADGHPGPAGTNGGGGASGELSPQAQSVGSSAFLLAPRRSIGRSEAAAAEGPLSEIQAYKEGE